MGIWKDHVLPKDVLAIKRNLLKESSDSNIVDYYDLNKDNLMQEKQMIGIFHIQG